MYDRENQTYSFTDRMAFDVVFFFAFEDLPEHVRRYSVIRASRRFQTNTIGSPELHKFTENDEFDAKAEIMRWEMNNKDDSFLQFRGVAHILNRRA